ncbi:uncharacterized protein LOC110023791 [Phalaenopsis equestris]|uniref:uncharacterized protein LOC110023791 n=1 Tax=Phalaenopsis equestris TaxID=78828 RepID=UPI0009E596CA|nr:uncharacterized protein LOC110023791 [Phalaenopsis equestris]
MTLYTDFSHLNIKIYEMQKSFREMVFEWEYLHPKGSLTNKQEPVADTELEDEPQEEEIYNKEAIFAEENLAMEEEIASQVMEEETDWGLQSLLFVEEEEDDRKMLESFADPKVKEKCDFVAFRLNKWLRSGVIAAATVSIFILGGGKAQLMGKRNNIQSEVIKKEEVKDCVVQHQPTALPFSSFVGHYSERF